MRPSTTSGTMQTGRNTSAKRVNCQFNQSNMPIMHTMNTAMKKNSMRRSRNMTMLPKQAIRIIAITKQNKVPKKSTKKK